MRPLEGEVGWLGGSGLWLVNIMRIFLKEINVKNMLTRKMVCAMMYSTLLWLSRPYYALLGNYMYGL